MRKFRPYALKRVQLTNADLGAASTGLTPTSFRLMMMRSDHGLLTGADFGDLSTFT